MAVRSAGLVRGNKPVSTSLHRRQRLNNSKGYWLSALKNGEVLENSLIWTQRHINWTNGQKISKKREKAGSCLTEIRGTKKARLNRHALQKTRQPLRLTLWRQFYRGFPSGPDPEFQSPGRFLLQSPSAAVRFAIQNPALSCGGYSYSAPAQSSVSW